MIKCYQSSKPNISNCENWRNLTFAGTPHTVLVAPSSIQQLKRSTSKTANSWYKPSHAMQALIYYLFYRYASSTYSLIYEQTKPHNTTQLPVVKLCNQTPSSAQCSAIPYLILHKSNSKSPNTKHRFMLSFVNVQFHKSPQ